MMRMTGRLRRVTVAPHERALVYRNRGLENVLLPGVHWTGALLDDVTVQVHDLSTDGALDDRTVERLLIASPALLETHFDAVELGEDEVGIVRRNGVLVDVQRPATRKLYWRGPYAVDIERLDIARDRAVPASLAPIVADTRRTGLTLGESGDLLPVLVAENAVGLLLVDGVLERELAPGLHLFWQFGRALVAHVVNLRVTPLEVSGQEILTGDRVSIRVNLSAAWKVVDPLLVTREYGDVREHVYREMQLALRRAIGARTLDEMLGDKAALDEELLAEARSRLEGTGVEITSAGVRDVILPGEMKELLNQVVAAEKAAQANNIRRREETAATRSLLNTAKLMADHPTLMRLKELEALERVTERVDRLTVYGGLDGVMNGLVRIGE